MSRRIFERPIFSLTTPPRIFSDPLFPPAIPGTGTRLRSVPSRPLQRVLVLSLRPYPLSPTTIPWLFGNTFRSRISLSCRRLQRVLFPPFPVLSPHPPAPFYPRRTHTRLHQVPLPPSPPLPPLTSTTSAALSHGRAVFPARTGTYGSTLAGSSSLSLYEVPVPLPPA